MIGALALLDVAQQAQQLVAVAACEAAGEVEAFLLRHGGAGWRIESVRRTRSERFPDALPQADLQGRLAATFSK